MMLGDNESVVNSAAIPHSKMHKRWVALSYHRVRYAVAAGILNIYHVAGKKNPADILSKHWDLPSVWNTMKPLLFWNWKLMAPEAAGKEGSNIETKDVAELVSKLDAKYNVKVTAQGKGQKNDHVLIEGSDNGSISPVIQAGNQGSRPKNTVRPKGKDTNRHTEQSKGIKK
jgi:hypothetical protein